MPSSDTTDGLIEQAWELAYLDPHRSLELGHQVVAQTADAADTVQTGFGWLHVALAEVRIGSVAKAAQALQRARTTLERLGHARGLALCDEVKAIELRASGQYSASQALQRDIDARPERAYTDNDRFIAHNSRAITCKLLGRNDDALRHFYRAFDAAQRTGWVGPAILALGNLGGFHQDLYNLEDARALSEKALNAARAAGARQSVATTASNLIIIYHAASQPADARAMAEFLLTHPEELVPDALERYALPLALGFLCSGDLPAAQRYLDKSGAATRSDGGAAFWAWLQARVALARNDPWLARQVAESTIAQSRLQQAKDQPYDLLELHRAAADACEAMGDLAAALAFTRRAQALYEELVGRSARARHLALQVSHDVDGARRERDQAVLSQQTADDDRVRLTQLNLQLQAQMAETEMLQERLREQALRDPLTGLHNRRYLFEVVPKLLELARRQGHSLCLVLLDLDHFKVLNDTWGHQAGDAVLQAFGKLLIQTLRRSDVICRHGGEEFVVVMPDIGTEGASATLHRLLEAFGGLQVHSDTRVVQAGSFSAGLATYPHHGDSLDQLLSRADRALYAAKDAGRGRIEVAHTTGFSTLI